MQKNVFLCFFPKTEAEIFAVFYLFHVAKNLFLCYHRFAKVICEFKSKGNV